MKQIELDYWALDFYRKSLVKANEDANNQLKKFLSSYPEMIDVSHDAGISHRITDYSQTDEMGIPMNKAITHIGIKDDRLVAICEDGTFTDDFSIDDMCYLLDDICDGYEVKETIEKLK